MEDKRSQFFPLRGKKVPDDLKRASYFMPMRGRKGDGWEDEDYDINDENSNKRASSFMPMRGKKRYAAISDYLTKAGTYDNDVSEVLNPSSSHSFQTDDKRMLSFMPVRGKRSYDDSESPTTRSTKLTNNSSNVLVSNHSAEKRSVSFMPMRGRREFTEDVPGGIVTSLLEKKKYSFMPMRGRRETNDADGNQVSDKKAIFMSMRGRKFNDEQDFENYPMDFASKKAQSFMPMRGRRAQMRDIVFEGSNLPETESRLIEDKRASSFLPMRGRSDASYEAKDVDSKRPSSFTLMRGRRSTEYLEEEKDTLDQSLERQKRATFLPMRGRRLVDEDFEVEPWPADQLMPLLDKKSSAFMPMRGRRLSGENFTVDPWQADLLMSLLNKKSTFMPMRGRRFVNENITVDPWPAEQLMSLFNKRSAFVPMRGRRDFSDYSSHGDGLGDFDENSDKRSSYFMPMRGRRYVPSDMNFYNPYPYLMAGIGSSLMSKPFSDQGVLYDSVRSANERRKKLKINWDSVKRAFHATRGKRFHDVDDFIQSLKDSFTSGTHPSTDDYKQQTRSKRSIIRPRMVMKPNRQYIGTVSS